MQDVSGGPECRRRTVHAIPNQSVAAALRCSGRQACLCSSAHVSTPVIGRCHMQRTRYPYTLFATIHEMDAAVPA
jgi:hypothetical protein